MKRIFNLLILGLLALAHTAIFAMDAKKSTESAAGSGAQATAAAGAPTMAQAAAYEASVEEAELLKAVQEENLGSVTLLMKTKKYTKSFLERTIEQIKATVRINLPLKKDVAQLLSIIKQLQSKLEQIAINAVDMQIKGLHADINYWFAVFGTNKLRGKIQAFVENYKPTPLMKEAFLGNEKTVAELLKTDAAKTINEQCLGKTALMFAAMMNRAPIVKILLAHGANTQLSDNDGNTALHHATTSYRLVEHKLSVHDSKERFAIIDMLVKGNALINARNIKGHTPLMQSCMDIFQNGTVAHLLKVGADAMLHDNDSNESLTFAQAVAHSLEVEKLARYFSTQADITKKFSMNIINALTQQRKASGETATSVATAAQTDLTQKADGKSGDAKSKGEVHLASQPTPLMLAVAQNEPAQVKQRAEEPFAVHTMDRNLQTALHQAALNGACSEVITILIVCGADVTQQDKNGATPIMLACCESRNPHKNKLNTLKALLAAYNRKHIQKDADDISLPDYQPQLNIADKHGRTALHYAILHHDLPLTQFLVNVDADVLMDIEDCPNAVEYARKQLELMDASHPQRPHLLAIIELLKSCLPKAIHTFDASAPLIHIVRTECVDALRATLAKRANKKLINNYDKYGKTALMYAAIEGNVEKMTLLVAAGADVKLKDKNPHRHIISPGHTAAHFAVMYNHLDALKYLHSQTADLNATTESGATALMFSVTKRSPDIFDYLLDHGAKPAAQTTTGATALSLAQERYKTDNASSHKKYMVERLESIRNERLANLNAEKEALEKKLLEEKQRRADKKARLKHGRKQLPLFKSIADSAGSKESSPETTDSAPSSASPISTPLSDKDSSQASPSPAALASAEHAPQKPAPAAAAAGLARTVSATPTSKELEELNASVSPLTLAASPAVPSASPPILLGSSPDTVEISIASAAAAGQTAAGVPLPPAQNAATAPLTITLKSNNQTQVVNIDPNASTTLKVKLSKKAAAPTALHLFRLHGSNQKTKEQDETAIANPAQLERMFKKTKQELYTKFMKIEATDLNGLLDFYEKEKEAYKSIATHLAALEKKKHEIDLKLKKNCLNAWKSAKRMHAIVKDQIDEQA
jgi:ankyrin repeat protein